MVRNRIKSKQELLDYSIGRYNFYRKILNSESTQFVPKFYLQEFLKDLLLIQAFANSKDADNDADTSEERGKGVA